jgi:hypothetical protein
VNEQGLQPLERLTDHRSIRLADETTPTSVAIRAKKPSFPISRGALLAWTGFSTRSI